MRRIALTTVTALAVLTGCGDDEPVAGRKAADYQKDRAALMERIAKSKERKAKEKAGKEPTVQQAVPDADPEEASFGAVDGAFEYSAKGRDPFRSFEWERPDKIQADAAGPLEQYDVNQLEVVAVVWNAGRARALVEDPSGQTYVIGPGASIGKNSGRVTQIDDDLVVVKETYVDFMGQETIKDVELPIRGSEGG